MTTKMAPTKYHGRKEVVLRPNGDSCTQFSRNDPMKKEKWSTHTHTHISLEIAFISGHHFNQMGKSKLTTWNHSHFSLDSVRFHTSSKCIKQWNSFSLPQTFNDVGFIRCVHTLCLFVYCICIELLF